MSRLALDPLINLVKTTGEVISSQITVDTLVPDTIDPSNNTTITTGLVTANDDCVFHIQNLKIGHISQIVSMVQASTAVDLRADQQLQKFEIRISNDTGTGKWASTGTKTLVCQVDTANSNSNASVNNMIFVTRGSANALGIDFYIKPGDDSGKVELVFVNSSGSEITAGDYIFYAFQIK